MKILICSFTYYPSVNGVQNVTEYQAEGLVARGHEVTVLTGYPKGRNCQPEEFYNGVHIQRFHASTDNMLHCGNKKAYQKLLLKLSVTKMNFTSDVESIDIFFILLPNNTEGVKPEKGYSDRPTTLSTALEKVISLILLVISKM